LLILSAMPRGSGEEQRMNGMTKADVKWEELILEVRGSSYALQ
jgi:hypothetical protein